MHLHVAEHVPRHGADGDLGRLRCRELRGTHGLRYCGGDQLVDLHCSTDPAAAGRLAGAEEGACSRRSSIGGQYCYGSSIEPACQIVGEFIGAEPGLGKLIIEAEARANAAEMMAAMFVMMNVGTILAVIVRGTQAYQLRWQPQFEVKE